MKHSLVKSDIFLISGTEAWSGPEVIHGGTLSSKTDIFPLGLVFWEMFALAPPHSLSDDSTDSVMTDEYDYDAMFEKYGELH